MFDSVSSAALHSALDGLAARSRAIADNTANINTPHYLAAKVDFEDALRDAVAGGSGVAGSTQTRSTAPTREDGNNVDLQTETMSGIDTQLRYQLLSQAASEQFTLVGDAIK